MSILLIKKAVKPLGILLIISLFSINCFSQTTKKPLDSTALQKELDSVLSKYGLKSKGFVINVISVNQKGGQTAYSITNNYYGDTLKSATNFGFDTLTRDGKLLVAVYPKKGVWQSPFIGIDSLNNKDCSYDPGAGLISWIPGIYLTFENDTVQHNMFLTIRDGVCSKNIPMIVTLNKPDAFFLFGDYTDDEKFYLYHKGKAVVVPKK
jgi:hypothetical protein